MQIIPAIDIIDGKCVRLTQGDFAQKKIYSTDPVAVAKDFEQAGIKRLHLVDLDGARAGQITNMNVLEEIARATILSIDFGGGVKTREDAKSVLAAGAAFVTIGSLAVKSPEIFTEIVTEIGAEKFFIGADVLNYQIKISGWLQDGGITIFQFLENMLAMELNHFFCTDIAKDGAMQGPSTALYKEIIEQLPGIRLTASGGVRTIADLEELKAAGCNGAIVGKAIYEGTISMTDLKRFS